MDDKNYIGTYGNLAFGIASLLILYHLIINPELEKARDDRLQLQRLIEVQVKIGSQLEETTEVLKTLLKEKKL